MAFTKTNDNSITNSDFDTTATITLTANAGDFIYILAEGGDTGTGVVTGVADATNGAYVIGQTVVDTFNNRRITQAYFTNSAALAGATITVTYFAANGGPVYVYAAAWSGADAVTGFDVEDGQFQSNPATSTDAVTSTAQTTTAADLILGATYDSNPAHTSSTNFTAGTGFTFELNNYNTGAHGTLAIESLVQGAAGSQAATFTIALSSGQVSTMMMAVKPGAASTFIWAETME